VTTVGSARPAFSATPSFGRRRRRAETRRRRGGRRPRGIEARAWAEHGAPAQKRAASMMAESGTVLFLVPAALDPHVDVTAQLPVAVDPVLLRLGALPVPRDPLPVAVAPVPVTPDPHVALLVAGLLVLVRGRRATRPAVVLDDHRGAAAAVAVVAHVGTVRFLVPVAVDPHVDVAAQLPVAVDPVLLRLAALPVTRDPLPVTVAPLPVAADPHVALLVAGVLVLVRRRRPTRPAVVDHDRRAATIAVIADAIAAAVVLADDHRPAAAVNDPLAVDPDPAIAALLPVAVAPGLAGARALPVTVDPHVVVAAPLPVTADPDVARLGLDPFVARFRRLANHDGA
jgi:hypothetical protein